MYDIAIIGAGVVGCATARYLSRYALSVCVLEKAEDVCCGTSKANSAIVHAGFDAVPGTNKARYNVRGNEMMESLCQELDVPFRRNGSLVLCFEEESVPKLQKLAENGRENGVPGLQILTGDDVHKLEPALSKDVVAALLAPSGGIVCPFTLTYALAENAAANGVEFFFNTEVRQITHTDSGFTLETNNGSFQSKLVINCAGVNSDLLHNQVCDRQVAITPRRGQYCLFDKCDGGLVSHTIFQLPGKMGKGVLVTPTVHGNLLVGPTAEDILDRDGVSTTAEGLDSLLATASASVPNLPVRDVITSFAGLRAHISEGYVDFLVGESCPGWYDLCGIESPGLSAAPALGLDAALWAAEKLHAPEKENAVSARRGIVDLRALSMNERRELIRQNPAYGNIICRCEQISEGEILDAIRRVPGAKSLDGVKRRTRAGMGRCQGGFCAPRVMELLSRELGISQTELTKSGGESRLLFGKTKEVL